MIDDGKEHYEFVMGESNIDITLPSPLDEPMKKIEIGGIASMLIDPLDVAKKLNELIERQNALEEIVKRLILKG